MNAKEVGSRLLIALDVSGIESQSELARRMGITRSRISQYVQGQRMLMPDVAANACVVLGCDFNWLYGGDARCLMAMRQARPK